MTCKEFEQSLMLYLYDELEPGERSSSEEHRAACASCQAEWDKARRFADLLGQRPAAEPSPEMLVRCRQSLDEALDREELGWRGLVPAWLRSLEAVPASRAVSVLTVLVFGFGLGWTLRSRPATLQNEPQGVNNINASSFAGPDLENVRIRGISGVTPDSQPGTVRITLDAERRMTLQGSLDNPRIQQVLVNAMKSYDNPGIRRDTLDVLQARGNDPNIRPALLYAVGHDPNLGVRLQALDAVRGMQWGADARSVLLDVLEHDTNAGLRDAAIDLLARHPDDRLLPVFERLAASDSNRYVRLRSATAIRAVEEKQP